jgi:hypothetical protein
MEGVLIVRLVTVMFALLFLIMTWNVGGFCRVMSRIKMRLQLENWMKLGRERPELTAKAVHQSKPLPSIVPDPLNSTSVRLEPVMKVVVPDQLV